MENETVRCLCAWYERCEVCDKPFPNLPKMALADYGKYIRIEKDRPPKR